MSNEFAIDFETYWDSEVTLKKIPTWKYAFHPKAVPYLVAIHNDDTHIVGPPSAMDWSMLHGATLWAHNAHFDGLVWQRLVRDGVIPESVRPLEWQDTADLVSYRRYCRTLKDSARVILGRELEKGVRDRTRGKDLAQIRAEGWEDELLRYGGEDARACWDIQKRIGSQWPEHERHVSQRSREACWRGITVNRKLAEEYLDVMNAFLFEIERDIPWEWDPDKTPLAVTEIRKACREAGIYCPASFAKDDVQCAKWETEFAEKYPWVRGIRYWRRVAFIRGKVKQLLNGVDENDVYHYDMRYCGADTGRFAAGSGRTDSDRFSVHGMPRFPIYLDRKNLRFIDGATLGAEVAQDLYAIDVRKLLVARDAHTFIIWDLAQIEPRLIHWFSGNMELLDKIREHGASVYQAEAEVAYKWIGSNLKKENPQLYTFIKTQYLGGQYQCGWSKLQLIAHKAGIELTDAMAQEVVTGFRSRNPKVVALWASLLSLAKLSANHKEDFEMILPSGRVLDYVHMAYRKGDFSDHELSAQYLKGDTPWKVYGGSLTNNLVQGTGRDVLCHKATQLEEAGFGWPLWMVHDEGINEVPDDVVAKGGCDAVHQLIEMEIPWAPRLPLSSEVAASKHYMK